MSKISNVTNSASRPKNRNLNGVWVFFENQIKRLHPNKSKTVEQQIWFWSGPSSVWSEAAVLFLLPWRRATTADITRRNLRKTSGVWWTLRLGGKAEGKVRERPACSACSSAWPQRETGRSSGGRMTEKQQTEEERRSDGQTSAETAPPSTGSDRRATTAYRTKTDRKKRIKFCEKYLKFWD